MLFQGWSLRIDSCFEDWLVGVSRLPKWSFQRRRWSPRGRRWRGMYPPGSNRQIEWHRSRTRRTSRRRWSSVWWVYCLSTYGNICYMLDRSKQYLSFDEFSFSKLIFILTIFVLERFILTHFQLTSFVIGSPLHSLTKHLKTRQNQGSQKISFKIAWFEKKRDCNFGKGEITCLLGQKFGHHMA